MKQNKWIITGLLFLAAIFLPDQAAAQWKVGLNAGYTYNSYSIDTQYAYDFNYDGLGGLTVGIPVEYGILDWLAVRADLAYLQKGHTMSRVYNPTYRDRRDHYLSLPVMARFSFGGERYADSSMPEATWATGRKARCRVWRRATAPYWMT